MQAKPNENVHTVLSRISKTHADQVVKANKWMQGQTTAQFLGRVKSEIETRMSGISGNGGPVTTQEYFLRDLQQNKSKYRKVFLRRIDEEARLEEQQFDEAEKLKTREGLELLADGKLTKEWFENNKSYLSNSDFRRFSKALNKDKNDVRTDPETYTSLIEQARKDPDTAEKEAMEAYNNGRLAQGPFTRIISEARRSRGKDKYPATIQEKRRTFQRAIKPKLRDGESAKRYMQAIDNLDTFIDEQLDRGFKGSDLDNAVKQKIETLIDENSEKESSETLSKMTLPKFADVTVDKFDEAELQEAMKKTIKALSDKAISQEEYEQQAEILKEWYDMFKASKK